MKKLILTLCLMTFGLSAQAGLWVEPYVGYGFNSLTLPNAILDQDLTATYNGLGYGGRVGIETFGLLAGVDYNQGSGTLSFDTDGLSAEVAAVLADRDITSSNLGVYVGYKLPLLFKVWGTYWLDSKVKMDGETTKGDGYSLGIGIAPIPFPVPMMSLYLNLEYKMITFDDESDGKEILLSVSMPINI